MTEPAIHELAREIAELEKQHAVLEERMNTKHAEYATAAEKLTGETRSAIERLQGETRAAMERLRTDIERMHVEAEKRENRKITAMFSCLAVIITLLALLIGLES